MPPSDDDGNNGSSSTNENSPPSPPLVAPSPPSPAEPSPPSPTAPSPPSPAPQNDSEPVKETKIKSAVVFLENPNVQKSSELEKKAFLRSKGLTEEEIDLAFKSARPSSQPLAEVKKKTYLTLLKDYASYGAVLSSIVYVVYKFYCKFIKPYFDAYFQRREDQINEIKFFVQDSFERMEKRQLDLDTKIESLSTSVSQISTIIVNEKLQRSKDIKSAMEPLKQDLTTLKKFVLSFKQFPTTAPAVKEPFIPNWVQEKAKSLSTKEENREVSNNIDKVNGKDQSAENGEDQQSLETPKPTTNEYKPSILSMNDIKS